MIQTVVDGGGVDAVTRSSKLGEKDVDGSGRSVRTGVDGFRPEVHGGMLELLKNLSDTIPPDNGMIAKAAEEDKPFIIAAFDSSAGGLIAAHNLANFILHRSHHASQFVILTDFGNAPYGPRERDDLVCLVGNGLKTAQKMGIDVIAMACNTACLSFPESKRGVEIPVVDLIATTANAIAEHGGKKPVVLSTEATAKDDMYKNRIHEAFKRNALAKKIDEHDIEYPEVVRIGAGDKADTAELKRDWASLINSVTHLSDNGADTKEMTRVIAKYVDKIPADATSVWLCCTHYPALKDQIVQRMKDIGRGHIEVIDPMEYQADEIIKEMNRMTDLRKGGPSVDVGSKNRDIRPRVITTGKLGEATNAAHYFLRSPNGAEIIQAEFNGTEFDLEAIPAKDRYGLKRFSQTSFNSSHEIWRRPGPGEEEEFNEKANLFSGNTSFGAEPKKTTKEGDDNNATASSSKPPSLPPDQTDGNTNDSLITSKEVGDNDDDNKEKRSTRSAGTSSKKGKKGIGKLFSRTTYKDLFKKRKDDENGSGGTSTGKVK
jgi:glutamate racemase